MNRLLGHFSTITHHKILVGKTCFRVGLYKQGLLHDLSKYSPVEFLPGVKYYQGFRSPIYKEKIEKGYSEGWLHHKGRNKHHYEYWIDFSPEPGKGLVGMKMPKKYVVEMFIDRVCAGKIYLKDKFTASNPIQYYEQGRDFCVIHPETERLLLHLLRMYEKKGEEYTLRYIKKVVLKDKNADY